MEVRGDCILGHEAAGVVLKCGEGVTNLIPGKFKTFIMLPRLIPVRIY